MSTSKQSAVDRFLELQKKFDQARLTAVLDHLASEADTDHPLKLSEWLVNAFPAYVEQPVRLQPNQKEWVWRCTRCRQTLARQVYIAVHECRQPDWSGQNMLDSGMLTREAYWPETQYQCRFCGGWVWVREDKQTWHKCSSLALTWYRVDMSALWEQGKDMRAGKLTCFFFFTASLGQKASTAAVTCS